VNGSAATFSKKAIMKKHSAARLERMKERQAERLARMKKRMAARITRHNERTEERLEKAKKRFDAYVAKQSDEKHKARTVKYLNRMIKGKLRSLKCKPCRERWMKHLKRRLAKLLDRQKREQATE
jgi:formylmethanofuran dehydrogenase subunit E